MTSDKALIEQHGGPAKVAELLGFDKNGGTQRVHNWMTRGIPARVKLQFPAIFPNDQPSPELAEKSVDQKEAA